MPSFVMHVDMVFLIRIQWPLMKLRLHEWRDRRGMSYRQLGTRAGVSIASIYRVENGQTSPTITWLELVATALSIEVVDLLEPKRRRKDIRRTNR